MLKNGRVKRLLWAASCMLALFAFGTEAADKKSKLNPQEQKVIDYLTSEWGKDYSVTSVDIAMDAVGVKQSDETRFRIGSYIKAHPEIHEVVRRWGWVTLVLTPDEKLIARTLINAEREGKPVPTLSEVAKAAGVSEANARRGLVMLERYEITMRDKSASGIGYKVIPRYVKWEPRLDFLFHTVTLESGRRFNTN
ncbi:MAG: hypothetical protein AB1631_22170 [Acidobacteriota bacterium]